MIAVQHVTCPGCHTFRPAVLVAASGLAAVDRHTAGFRRFCATPDGLPWVVRLDPNAWRGRAAAWTA